MSSWKLDQLVNMMTTMSSDGRWRWRHVFLCLIKFVFSPLFFSRCFTRRHFFLLIFLCFKQITNDKKSFLFLDFTHEKNISSEHVQNLFFFCLITKTINKKKQNSIQFFPHFPHVSHINTLSLWFFFFSCVVSDGRKTHKDDRNLSIFSPPFVRSQTQERNTWDKN